MKNHPTVIRASINNLFNHKKEFCSQCSVKLGFFRYKPKPDWKMDGQLCRNCWDSIKAKNE